MSDQQSIVVYCSACESRNSRPYIIAEFVHGYDGTRGDPVDPAGWWRINQYRSHGGGKFGNGARDYYDENSSRRAEVAHSVDASRYVLPCPGCGDRVVIRADKARQMLNQVAAAGKSRVSLTIVRQAATQL